jgi:hypothetical protein
MGNTIQSLGNFTATIVSPLLLAGTAINLKGQKLETTFIQTDQLIENSKMIPLVNNETATITNSQTAGRITFSNIQTDGTIEGGDLTVIASTLVALGDSNGSEITISYARNGATIRITFNGCTVAKAPPLLLAGNDLPDYQIIFNYSSFVRG